MLNQKIIAVLVFIIVAIGQIGVADVLWDYNVAEDYQRLSEFSMYNPPSIDCCFCLAIDGNNLLIGTSMGVLCWNQQEDKIEIFKTDTNWGGEYARTLRDANEKNCVEKWLSNSVEKIVVLSPGQIWVDMFKGVLVIRDGQEVYYASFEEALQSLYSSDLKKLLRKVVAVDSNEHLYLLKGEKEGFIDSSVLKYYNGAVWEEEQSRLCDNGNTFSRKKFLDIIADAKGAIWACGHEGIFQNRGNCWDIVERGGYAKFWQGSDGILWAFGRGKLAELEVSGWKVYKGHGKNKDFSVLQHYLHPQPVILQTPDSKLWFAAIINYEGKAVCFDGKEFGQDSFYPLSATSNKKGQIFVASGERLFSYDKGKWEQILIPCLKKRGAGSHPDEGWMIRDILVNEKGTVYVATVYDGILRYDGGKWDRLSWKENGHQKNASGKEADEKSKLSSDEQWLASGGVGPVPEGLIQKMYRSYIESEGRDFIKATNEQLSKHIVNIEDNGSVISYYRLISRDKKLANVSFREMIKTLCSSGRTGEFTSAQIACFGPQTVDVLLDIAKTGTEQERVLAIDSLAFMKDPNVVDKLLEMLDDSNKLEELSYFRLVRMAIASGKPEGMSLLIQGAATEGKYQEAYQTELDRVTSTFQDVPNGWSLEKWRMWWQKHRSSWQPCGDYLDPMLVNSVKAQQRLLEVVAEKIESEKH